MNPRVIIGFVALAAALVAGGAGFGIGRSTAPTFPAGTTTGTATAVSTQTPAPHPTPIPTPPLALPRVGLFGDSLIYGSGLPAEQDYQHDLARLRPENEYFNFGFPGAQASDLLDRARGMIELHPAVVVVWVGTNDALNGVPLATFADQMRTLMTLLGSARVVLVTPVADQSKPNAYVPYAEAIRTLAKEQKRPLVDLAGVAGAAADYQPDGAHLNADAALRVSQALAKDL